jgi:2-phosphoglycerate kinase
MKTIVVSESDQSRVPFLRGILTRSLLDAGLDFEDAFSLASRLRDDLSERSEVTTEELRQRVGELLEEKGHLGALEPYTLPLAVSARIMVVGRDGTSSAFSRSLKERVLQAAGVKPEKAEKITDLLFEQLVASGLTEISTQNLAYVTYLCLQQEVSKKAARRFMAWHEFCQSGKELTLLICGTVGTGKSTVATEVGHVLDIVRIQSTDMLREVMRMMMPKRLLPVLHTSSFKAWKALALQDLKDRDRDQVVADGYSSQSDLLSVACEAVLQRAAEENVSIILEGVHAHPDLLQHLPEGSDAIAVHVMLAVLKPKELRSRLKGRGKAVPQREARKYLNKFESVWSLQSFLLSEADRCDVPIITNHDKEKAIHQVILQVNYELSRQFSGTAEDVFGTLLDPVSNQTFDGAWQDAIGLLAE